MVGGGGAPAFPVVFFDGEREMNIGNIKINPKLEYKPFQLMLSQKIGISPNQISIYIVDRNKNLKMRRIPITGKVNFGWVCHMKDCCVLVVLKRSKKVRNRRNGMIAGVEFGDYLNLNKFSQPVPENLRLLWRNEHITQSEEITDLNVRLQNLRVHRENCQISLANRAPGLDPNLYSDSFPTIHDTYRTPLAPSIMKSRVCEECENSEMYGYATSFHFCINDAVLLQSTPRLGPIKRPINPLL